MVPAFDLVRPGSGPDPYNQDMGGGDGGRTVPSGAAAVLRISSPQHSCNPGRREKFRSDQVSHASDRSTEQRSWRQWYWIVPGAPGHVPGWRNQDQVQGRHADHCPQASGPGADLAHPRPGPACHGPRDQIKGMGSATLTSPSPAPDRETAPSGWPPGYEQTAIPDWDCGPAMSYPWACPVGWAARCQRPRAAARQSAAQSLSEACRLLRRSRSTI
jgi:hypothetical protein